MSRDETIWNTAVSPSKALEGGSVEKLGALRVAPVELQLHLAQVLRGYRCGGIGVGEVDGVGHEIDGVGG